MPIDPYAALNAMIRAEAARFAPPVRTAEAPAASSPAARECGPVSEPRAESGPSESERRQAASADSAA
ncbi:hypothetical protein OHU17_17640 [Streptomyces goshikiensis]|uniref:Uncharacterized protein n=1 Tax=Streptomyces goshikiensis TaxID=1942 RepID=A0ABZ1RL58_9ACTN|nr:MULTISPECIES: hypothetical protein [Streptomyces]AKL67017.1 hypothetical protein M444_18300 [Streptomyces sp. Mg1]MBP0935334.1 hypothetical protein [Streptomyces sp. KCTC 0041BP]OKI33694.1 hypothetical protein A6A28_07215 [Streptomyces sp. CB03578]PJN19078.1 hypothetical protein CG724_09870 [Streptomyces sp. CB02120-2]RPK48326.1 hypothetical protein EES37_08920 [Streptomyces sp. ADI91-18]